METARIAVRTRWKQSASHYSWEWR